MAGHVRPAALASQRRQLQALGFRLHTRKKEWLSNILPELLVPEAEVSAQDGDVRKFLQGGGSKFRAEFHDSLYFPPLWLANAMD